MLGNVANGDDVEQGWTLVLGGWQVEGCRPGKGSAADALALILVRAVDFLHPSGAARWFSLAPLTQAAALDRC